MKPIFLAFTIVFNFLSSPWSNFTTNYTFSYFESQLIQNELSTKLLRLHVLAASDATKDQKIKLLVKNEAISFLENLLSDCNSKEEAIATITTYIPTLEKTLQDFLSSIHCSQTITISLEYTYFPVKIYGDLVFPSGYYDALRIVLDKGEGQNWWCVLYPPLCFTDVCTMSVPKESKTQLEETISHEAWNSIQMDKENNKPQIRFWIVDFVKNIFTK